MPILAAGLKPKSSQKVPSPTRFCKGNSRGTAEGPRPNRTPTRSLSRPTASARSPTNGSTSEWTRLRIARRLRTISSPEL